MPEPTNQPGIEPADLRARLLDVEPLNDERLARLQQELQMVFNKPLSRGERISAGVGAAVAMVFLIGSITQLAHDWHDPVLRMRHAIFAAAMLGSLVVALSAFARRMSDMRLKLAMSKLLPAVALIATLGLLARAAVEPSIPALAWALFAGVWLVISVAIVLYNRMIVSELTTREAMLRLELRLAEGASGR